MSEPENNPPAKVDNRFNEAIADDVEELRSSVNSLQSLVSTSLILLLVFSVCVNIFIGLEMMAIRSQVHTEEASIAYFQNNMAEVYMRLTDFAAKHPEYRPILSKYDQHFKVQTRK